MTSIFRCLKAEFLKCKHSVLLYIHILIPLLGAIILLGIFWFQAGMSKQRLVRIWRF